MADYKDFITGTLNSLADKAREIAGSDAVTGFVDKVKTAAEGSTVYSVYEQGSSRARQYARIAKLRMELNGQNEELGRIYMEIGKLCCEQMQDNPDGFFAPLFEQAKAVTENIRAKQAEIDQIKAGLETAGAERDIEVEIVDDLDADIADFEQIVDESTEKGPTE